MAISGLLKGADLLADYTMGAASALAVGAAGGLIQAGSRVFELVPEGACQGALQGLAVARVVNKYGPIITPIATLALGFSILSDEQENDVVNSLLTVATVALANKVINYPKYTSCLEGIGKLIGAAKTSTYAIGKGFYEGARDSISVGFSAGRFIYSAAALPGRVIGGLIDKVINIKENLAEGCGSTAFTSLGKVASFAIAAGYSYVQVANLIEQLGMPEE